ncbi:hypothetical protein [Frondihabitans cladoniiphilus]|uniref:Alanine-rich protein n=1 Tax=Frondihabitans cladoniiphilus TaxID=715785 RepID=A0ABP8W9B1_9MICO
MRRLADSGADSVTLAAAYHSVRAATPRHPGHRVVDAHEAALYTMVRPAAWAGRALRPEPPGAWAAPDSFARASDTVTEAGLAVEAWIVLTHSSVAGGRVPDACVTNAFGDVYSYALCPSDDRVVEYATTLVSEIALDGAEGLVLEACGPLGFEHAGRHEKTEGGGWGRGAIALLSLCFCRSCRRALEASGLDPEEVAAHVRASVDRNADVDALGGVADVLLQVRRRSTARLAESVVSAARDGGVRRIAVHAQPDPWGVGPASAVLGRVEGVDSYIVPTSALEEGRAAADLRDRCGGASLAAYVSGMPPRAPDAPEKSWPALVDAGVDELYVYHAGLLDDERLTGVERGLAAVRSR